MRTHLPRILFEATIAVLAVTGAAAAAESVFRDDFSSPRSGWATREQESDRIIGFGIYSDGEYQMTPTANGTVGFSTSPRQAKGDDVSTSAKVWVYAAVGGGGAGVACRFSSHDRYYAFVLTGNNGWAILKSTKTSGKVLANGALAAAPLIPGMLEARMEARCVGDRLTMLVNGREVGSVRDAEYASGSSGLIVLGEKAAGTSARFDDFELRGF